MCFFHCCAFLCVDLRLQIVFNLNQCEKPLKELLFNSVFSPFSAKVLIIFYSLKYTFLGRPINIPPTYMVHNSENWTRILECECTHVWFCEFGMISRYWLKDEYLLLLLLPEHFCCRFFVQKTSHKHRNGRIFHLQREKRPNDELSVHMSPSCPFWQSTTLVIQNYTGFCIQSITISYNDCNYNY